MKILERLWIYGSYQQILSDAAQLPKPFVLVKLIGGWASYHAVIYRHIQHGLKHGRQIMVRGSGFIYITSCVLPACILPACVLPASLLLTLVSPAKSS